MAARSAPRVLRVALTIAAWRNPRLRAVRVLPVLPPAEADGGSELVRP